MRFKLYFTGFEEHLFVVCIHDYKLPQYLKKFYVLPTECVYVCCVYLRKTPTISLHSVSWLVSINDTEGLTWGTTEFSNIAVITFSFTAVDWVRPQVIPCAICGGHSGNETYHPPSISVSLVRIVPPMHRTRIHPNITLTRRTREWILRPFLHKRCYFRYRGAGC